MGKGENLHDFYAKQLTVNYEDNKLEIQIWKAKEINYEPDYYIFFIHNETNYAGIPFFSNLITMYWNFENENKPFNIEKNRNFENEYSIMTEKLAPDSSCYISGKVIPFLNFYFESTIINLDNINQLDALTLCYGFGQFSEKCLEITKKIFNK